MSNYYDFDDSKKKNEFKHIDVNTLFSELAESPEKLTLDIALQVYNDYPYKRQQIYSIFFKKIDSVEEWLEIYRSSKDDDLSKQLAKKNIQECDASVKFWIELFETEKDEFIERVSINKIKELSKTLEDWIFVYKKAAYGLETSDLALKRMREVSETYEEWKTVYELAPFGTKTQILALENLMVTARIRQKEEIEENERIREANIKSREDWKKAYAYEKDFYSASRDEAIVNMYLTAESV